MNFLKGFSKEQLACGSSVLFALFLVATLAGGGARKTARPPAVGERAYASPPSGSAEFVQDKFALYWEGRDIFSAVVTDKLEVPLLKLPAPRAEALVLLPLRPGVAFDTLNRSGLPTKYRSLNVASPSVLPTDLPADADFAALKDLKEPEAPGIADKRFLAMREYAIIHLPNGNPVEAKAVIWMQDGSIRFTKKDGVGGTMKLDQIAKDKKGRPWVENNWKYEEEYRHIVNRFIKPGDAAARVELGAWCRENGMLPDARTQLAEAVEIYHQRGDYKKEFYELVCQTGDLLREIGDFDGALALYRDASKWTDYYDAEFAARAGDNLRSLGLHESALEAYGASLQASPRFTKSRASTVRTLYDLGRDRDALQSAADLFARYSDTVKPAERVEALLGKGLSLLRTADTRGAQDTLTEVLKLDPVHAEALNALGAVYVITGALKEGGAQFVAAIKANQYATDAWLNLAGLALGAGKVAEAEMLYAAAAQRDPGSAEAMLGLAMVQIAKGVPKDALATVDSVLKMEPRHSFAHYVRGHLKLQEGAHDEAVAGFSAALQGEFYFLPAYSGAAMAYLGSAAVIEKISESDPAKQEENRLKIERYRVNAETLLSTTRDFDALRSSTHVALGCVLAVQGRGVEANLAFQRALEITQAPDPLLAYGRGYIAYRQGDGDVKARIQQARGIFSQGAQMAGADAIDKQWIASCGEAAAKIKDWQETSVFFDDRFERPKSDDVGGGWIQRDKVNGVTIRIEEGRARWSSKQIGKDMGPTVLDRDVPKADFDAFETTLYPGSEKFEFGISLYFAQQDAQTWMGFHIGQDMNKRWRYQLASSREFPGGRLDYNGSELQKFELPDPKEIRLKVVRRSEPGGRHVFDVLFWKAAASEWVMGMKAIPVHTIAQNQSYRIAIWTRAPIGNDVTLAVDNTRVLLKHSGQ